jgi:hypothetical protein
MSDKKSDLTPELRLDSRFDTREDNLSYNCPSTGRTVRTAIVTNRATLAKVARVKLSVWCPHCDAPHKIPGSDAMFSFTLPKAG